jgi:3-oxoacyl-[acyl-carrier-protein] synthase II
MGGQWIDSPIVITGMGAVTPLGSGVSTLHDRWCRGEVGVEDGAGRCRDFDATESLSRKEIRSSDRFTQLALVATEEALSQAGWLPDLPYEDHRIAGAGATSIGGIQTCLQQQERALERGYNRVSPLAVVMQMPNAAASMVAQKWGFRGECLACVGACASGTLVFGSALRLFDDPNVDAVVVSAADAAITPQAAAAFRIMGALSESGVVRPFDRRRDGFVMGEGAGALILEREEAARRRGAPILGDIIGFGSTTDAFHPSAPEPTGTYAAMAIERALESAGLTPADLAYVNSHGTASHHNDIAETRAIKIALGEDAWNVPVSSTKSTIGHLMGAAGTVEAISAVSALNAGVAPPTLGHEEPDEGLDLNYVPSSPQPLTSGPDGRRVALSNSFGLGGHNAVVALRSAA